VLYLGYVRLEKKQQTSSAKLTQDVSDVIQSQQNSIFWRREEVPDQTKVEVMFVRMYPCFPEAKLSAYISQFVLCKAPLFLWELSEKLDSLGGLGDLRRYVLAIFHGGACASVDHVDAVC
jgi:hypothetical protein